MKAAARYERTRRTSAVSATLMLVSVVLAWPGRAMAQDAELTGRVLRVFEAHCTRCHGGGNPMQGMDLSAPSAVRATVNVPSRERSELRLIQPRDPEASYLVKKIRNDDDIEGSPMPLTGDFLSPDEIDLIIEWINSFPQAWGDPGGAGESGMVPVAESAHAGFFDGRNVLLPTPEPLGAGIREFDILHRFFTPVQDAGFSDLFGLDSGANISFQLGYGITPDLEIGVRRSGNQAHWEGIVKYRILPRRPGGLPVSVAAQAGYGLITRENVANRPSWTGQLIVGIQALERVSLLIVPSYATRTDPGDDRNEDGTLAIGLGSEIRFHRDAAFVLEAIPTVSGYHQTHPAYSTGLKYRVGGHTFMLLLTNAVEINTDLYLPGGDLDPTSDLRLGFNITRRIF